MGADLKLLGKVLCFFALYYLTLPLMAFPDFRIEMGLRALELQNELKNRKRQR